MNDILATSRCCLERRQFAMPTPAAVREMHRCLRRMGLLVVRRRQPVYAGRSGCCRTRVEVQLIVAPQGWTHDCLSISKLPLDLAEVYQTTHEAGHECRAETWVLSGLCAAQGKHPRSDIDGIYPNDSVGCRHRLVGTGSQGHRSPNHRSHMVVQKQSLNICNSVSETLAVSAWRTYFSKISSAHHTFAHVFWSFLVFGIFGKPRCRPMSCAVLIVLPRIPNPRFGRPLNK